jgi:hypothetical protein
MCYAARQITPSKDMCTTELEFLIQLNTHTHIGHVSLFRLVC